MADSEWTAEQVREALEGVKLGHQQHGLTVFEACAWDACMVGAELERLWGRHERGEAYGG